MSHKEREVSKAELELESRGTAKTDRQNKIKQKHF